MKLVLFALACCTLCVQQVSGQWKKLADFVDTSTGEALQFDCVYFLDLPGPPSVGYTSAGLLYKTTDGGHSWSKCITGSGLFEDIYFNDSTTGWAVGYNNPIRTIDGGKTWQKLYLPVIAKAPNGNYYYPPGLAVYYSSFSKKLFLGLEDSVMLVSSDSGDTWLRTNILSVAGFAFSSPKDGILVTNQVLDDSHHPFRWIDSLFHVYITSDGGNTWRLGNQPFSWQYVIQQPLAIPGTNTYFQVAGIEYIDTVGEIMAVFRSDDSGINWKQIYIFPNMVIPLGVIRGSLNRMYVQTNDSGMYTSTDQGISWQRTGGPSWDYNSSPRFYSKNGITIAPRAYLKNETQGWFDGLWERIDPLESVGPALHSSAVMLFPNPTHDHITIDLEAPAVYEVQDALGRVMRGPESVARGLGSVEIDVSSLPEGLYYVRLKDQGTATRILNVIKE